MVKRLTDKELAGIEFMLATIPEDGEVELRPASEQYRTDIPRLLAEIWALREELATAMRQNRKQDTALRVIRKCTPMFNELIESALTVGPFLVLDGETCHVDRLIHEAYPRLNILPGEQEAADGEA